jgi:hypothetical protein
MLRCVVRLLYGSGTRLVTQLNEEMSTATRRSSPRRRAVHHARRRDEDDPLSVLIRRRGILGCVGLCWASACWAAAGLWCWAWQLGCCGQVSPFSFISFIYFLFYFLF